MSINLIHVSDIHFGSGESHGRLNPETGLNVRFEDFVRALKKTVDYAIDSRVDVFLFSGDAYRNASPEPVYQKAFAEQLKRLSDAGIKIVVLVGNHDQILKSTASHSMSVFQSLEVPNLTVIDSPCLVRLETARGAMQLIGIPHVTRHLVMTHEKYASLTNAQTDRLLVSHISTILCQLYDELDASLPTVVTAHMMLEQARAGVEQELMIGYSMSFPLDIFLDERVDYVALGHVHRHQVLRESCPAVVYAGSLERVDFGEADEDKGFLHVRLARRNTQYEFHSLSPRPFISLDADLTSSESPTDRLSKLISRALIAGCVLRVRYKVRQDQLPEIDEGKLRCLAQEALSVQFRPEVVMVQRDFRMPQLNESAVLCPLAALETYLEQMAPERKDILLRRARELGSRLQAEEPE